MAATTTVLFDAYSTLLQDEDAQWTSTFETICAKQGLPVTGRRLLDSWARIEGEWCKVRANGTGLSNRPSFKSYHRAWRECFQASFAEVGVKGDAVAATRMAFDALACRQPYPDVLEALPHLQSRWRTGVLSNADDAFLLPALDGCGLRFGMVLTSEQGRAYKPDPSLFREALVRIGAKAAETLYVGDSPRDDVCGARLAGMRVAWVNRDGRRPPEGVPLPDYQVAALTELIPMLDGGE